MTKSTCARVAAAVVLLTGLVAAAPARAAATQQADAVHAEGAWLRVLPAGQPAGGYVTLRNEGDAAASLVGASSPRYGHVMLHKSSTEGGMGRMSMVDALAVPAHGRVALAPGGYHLMLMHAGTAVVPGDRVPVTLRFADGSTLAVDFLARPANATDGGEAASPSAGH